MKLIDLFINKNKISFSLEFFPPKTPKGIENLQTKIETLNQYHPLFIDLTWGAGGSTSELTLELASDWIKKNYNVNMHITCSNMSVDKINNVLNTAKNNKIKNLLVLRGDIPKDITYFTDFKSALDLVTHIKSNYHDDFCLGVSGYPEGHPDQIEEINSSDISSLSKKELIRLSYRDGKYYVCRDIKYNSDLNYLKQKINAGGSFIVSQLFFDFNIFLQFVDDCRSIGITCPIIPGIMLLQSYNSFYNMVNLCKVKVPQDLFSNLLQIKDQPELFIQFGINFNKNLISNLLSHNINHFHLYTLNQDTITKEIINFIIDSK